MKKLLVLLVFVVFFLGLTSANIETKYNIHEKKVLVRHYSGGNTAGLELKIPKNAISLKINAYYELEESENYNIAKIRPAENLSISYLAESMIDKSGKQFYFIAKNYLAEPQNIKLTLPESAVLTNGGILFPEPEEISSDGRSIILLWENFNEKQIVVDYEFVEKRNFILYFAILIILVAFIAYLIFQRKLFKRKTEKNKGRKKGKKEYGKILDIEEHLVESEKSIISELKKAEEKSLWQKQLQLKTGFSKAKLSRVIRNLESRSLIQKIPLGNTNKIKLKIK